MKKSAIIYAMIAIFCAINPSSIFAQNEDEDKTLSPYFFVKSDNGTTEQLPLKSTSAEVNIAGVIADVTISQVYRNKGTQAIEAVYVFPASTRAAVYGMEMKIGERTIIAKIREKNQARQEYEQAKFEGKRASLLEQERPNVFQMNVANIMPGDEIEVILKYTELLIPTEGIYEWIFPTVVGPRYTESSNATASTDNSFTAMPYTGSGIAPSFDFDLKINLEAGLPIQNVQSSTHKINVAYPELSKAKIALKAEEKRISNRDFVLQYQLAGKEVENGLLLYEGEKENHFLLMIQPPKRVETAQIPPREYIFIVDVSGSMNGFPIDISKNLLRDLITGLRPNDKFNVLLFASASEILADKSLIASEGNIAKAWEFLSRRRGGGGTRLLPAMKKALALPRADENLSRSVVIVTDGYVSVEPEAFDLVRNNLGNANMYSFGIGTSVNRHLIDGLAHVGMGEPLIVLSRGEAPKKAETFRKYINSPVLTQIKTQFKDFEVYDVEPEFVPDVLAERPIIISGKYRGKAKGSITLKGYTGNKKYNQTIQVVNTKPSAKNAALRYLWAREKIRLLGDYNNLRTNQDLIKEITDLGLKYNLMTAYTSFIAIDNEVIANKDGQSKTVNQALSMPEGVSNFAVGFEYSINKVMDFSDLKFAGNSTKKETITKAQFNKTAWENNAAITLNRPSITFILGEDENISNLYYKEAENYYRNHAKDRTDFVNNHCRSLLEVKQFLERSQQNGQPWGIINLVLHSNEWKGISTPIMPLGDRTTLESLQTSSNCGEILELPERIADKYTKIKLLACGLGKNQALVDALKGAFGGRADLLSTPYFMKYSSQVSRPDICKQEMAAVYYAFFKTGYRPGDLRLSNQLKKRYPNSKIDWRTALKNEKEKEKGKPFHYTFNIPIEWLITFHTEEDIPILETEAQQLEWLKSQKGLQSEISKMNIPMENFRWRFKKVMHKKEGGSEVPALKVDGKVTAVCVLEVI